MSEGRVMSPKDNDETSSSGASEHEDTGPDTVFDSLPAPCIETSTTGFIRRANQEAVNLFNVTRAFCTGRPMISFVSRADCPAYRNVLRASTSSATVERTTLRLRPRHGRPVIPVDLTVRRTGESLLWVLQPFPEQWLAGSQVAARSILYVEDDTDIREMLAEILSGEGFVVRTAANLEEARAAVEVAKFDVVITNYQLPDGDGTSFLESLGEERLRGSRVVMLTGHPKARRLKGIPCWMKPIDPLNVASRVRLLLATR